MSLSDLCSSKVTHVVAEDTPAHELWPWLQEHGVEDLDKMNVLDISWFTQSMRAGQPIPVEAQHRIRAWRTLRDLNYPNGSVILSDTVSESGFIWALGNKGMH
ncbi:DNA nucleotidylexotransferase isoform X1 [Tachysurus ichikawai]